MRTAAPVNPSAASWPRASSSRRPKASASSAGSRPRAAPAPGAHVVVLDLGVEQAEGREEPGRGRHDDARHLQRPGHPGGEERPVAAEGEERVLARVAAALARDRADRAHHVRRGDQVSAVGRLGERQAERHGDPLLEDLVGARRVELHRAAGQRRRVQVAEDDVGVGDGRLGAAEVVAERPGEAPALRGPTCSAPPASSQTIEPPPAPTSARSMAGTRRR